MRIYSLTSIGQNLASNPANNPSPAMTILYWLRRHGGRGTDEQIREFVVTDRAQMQVAIQKLLRAKAVTVVG